MTTKTWTLTKQDEIDLFDQTVSALPQGYVKDILSEARNDVLWAIQNDYCSVDVRATFTQLSEKLREVKALDQSLATLVQKRRDELKALEQRTKDLERRADRAQQELSTIRAAASRFRGIMADE